MRTLDALTANKVMNGVTKCDAGVWFVKWHDSDQWDYLPAFSGDIAAAWTVVEELSKRGIHVGNLYLLTPNAWVCEFHNRAHGKNDEWRAVGNSPMSAICRAAIMHVTGMDAEAVADMIRDAKIDAAMTQGDAQ